MPETACLSHKEDVDGISSAALIKAAFKTDHVVLVDYGNVISKLEKLAMFSSDKEKIDRIFICDLGLSKKNEQRFSDIVGEIISNGSKVTYIDHHELNKDTATKLKKLGVTLIHSIEECTSVQIYSKYKGKLDSHAGFFAAAGALTDYMETKPRASAIMSKFDKQFLMLEATALSYMISANQNNNEFLSKIVDTLAEMKYPHEIDGGFSIAEKYCVRLAQAMNKIEASVVKFKNLACVHSNVDLSASTIVNSVLGLSGKPVAMVYKLKDDINSYVISIRASKDSKVHLGRLVNEIATQVGGSGGGHEKASGAVIPKDKLDQFINLLDRQIHSGKIGKQI
jgi:single-stranded-DNA-specific exonuclease